MDWKDLGAGLLSPGSQFDVVTKKTCQGSLCVTWGQLREEGGARLVTSGNSTFRKLSLKIKFLDTS